MFSPTGVSPSMPTLSRGLWLTTTLFDSLLIRQNQLNGPTTPSTQRLPALTRTWFWPDPLSLATTNGIAVAFSSCGY